MSKFRFDNDEYFWAFGSSENGYDITKKHFSFLDRDFVSYHEIPNYKDKKHISCKLNIQELINWLKEQQEEGATEIMLDGEVYNLEDSDIKDNNYTIITLY